MVLNRLRSLSPIDAVAGVVALAALAGVVWSPKLSNAVAKATGAVTVSYTHLTLPTNREV